MDLTHSDLLFLFAVGIGFILGYLFAGFRAGSGVEVTFQGEGGTSSRLRANNPSEIAEIMRLMRQFETK